MDDFFDEEFEEFMSYELTHEDELTCEVCGAEFEDDGEQIGDRVLCPDCRLFEFDDGEDD